MTSRNEIPWLESEVTTIDRMLSEMHQLNPLSRMNLENRKAKALSKLEEARDAPPLPSQTSVTFRGEPLSDNTGVRATFAGSALKAISRMAGVNDADLSLAGSAWGHFGFRMTLLSEAPDSNRQIKDSIAALSASAKSADTLAETATQAKAEVIDGVREFVKLLLQNQATCSIEHDDLTFSFADLDEVKASANRLERI